MPEPTRPTAALALATFATLNALAWVLGVKLVAALVGVTVPSGVLGGVAAATGLAVLVATGALAARATPTA